MNQEEVNRLMLQRLEELSRVVSNLSSTNVQGSAVQPPALAPSGSGPEIDIDSAINAGHPERERNSLRGTRRTSSLLVSIPQLLSPSRPSSNPLDPTHEQRAAPIKTSPAPMLVSTVAEIKKEEKMTTVSARAMYRLHKLYREHKRKQPYSPHNLGDFINDSILEQVRANEFALKSDLRHALRCMEDLKGIDDDDLVRALARKYRSDKIHTPSQAGSQLYHEVDKIKWPEEYFNRQNNTWTIKPKGFHLTMFTALLEWTNRIYEVVEFMYLGATLDDLRTTLPAEGYGTRRDPGMVLMVMRGLGELSESVTTFIGEKKLEQVKNVAELVGILDNYFTELAGQSQILTRQEAQATPNVKADKLWELSNEGRNKETRQPFTIPAPRVPTSTFHYARRGPVIHAMDESQEEEHGMLAMVESPNKGEENSTYYSTCEGLDAENAEELFMLGQPTSVERHDLPCFDDYAGECKLGQACPYKNSHGNKNIMEERTRRLVMQVLKSKYGGRQAIADIIHQHQVKQNNTPGLVSQDYRQKSLATQARVSTPLSSSREMTSTDRRAFTHGSQETSLSPRPAGTNMMRERSDHGRGGGRLVTYGGRGNMGRGHYTNHLLIGAEQEHQQNQVEEVEEEQEGSS